MSDAIDALARLPIHVRRVASGDGEIDSQNETYCPLRDRSLAVEDCESCPDHAGLQLDLEGRHAFVLCRRLTPEAARSIPASARLPLVRRQPVASPSAGDQARVSEIMAQDTFCARPNLQLDSLARLMLARGVSGLPVIDDDGRPIGMVSKTDLLRKHGQGARVADVMTPLTFVLPENASVSQAAALMAFEGVHRLAVVGEDGKIIGIVSSMDVLRWLGRLDGYLPTA